MKKEFKLIRYNIVAWNIWWFRIGTFALVCQQSDAVKYFSERNGYEKWYYVWKIKLAIRKVKII